VASRSTQDSYVGRSYRDVLRDRRSARNPPRPGEKTRYPYQIGPGAIVDHWEDVKRAYFVVPHFQSVDVDRLNAGVWSAPPSRRDSAVGATSLMCTWSRNESCPSASEMQCGENGLICDMFFRGAKGMIPLTSQLIKNWLHSVSRGLQYYRRDYIFKIAPPWNSGTRRSVSQSRAD